MSFGSRNVIASVKAFDSSVIESAMIAVATLGSAVTLVVVALKLPWT